MRTDTETRRFKLDHSNRRKRDRRRTLDRRRERAAKQQLRQSD